jgi:hypothetical protein
VPATVVITPAGLTLRTRWLKASAMYRLPAASTAMPRGLLSWANVAWPVSPEKPATPVPATVVITPAGLTLRTRWLPVSLM